MRRLKAGGKYKSKVELWQEEPGGSWAVKSYHRGKWEALVAPTLDLARWLGDRQGLPGDAGEDFQSSIREFRSNGVLHLPQSYLSVGVTTELGRMTEAIRPDNVREFLPKMRKYVDTHVEDALAWDCLRRLSTLAREHRQALDASLQAARLAPFDGVIRYGAAEIYFTAMTNQLRNSLGREHLTEPQIKGCTLEALQVTYEDAYSAVRHHLDAAIDSSMTGDVRKAADMILARLLR